MSYRCVYLSSYVDEIKKLCDPNAYNLVLHKHLGDIVYPILLKTIFEKKYGKLRFIVRPQHEFLMKIFHITDYGVYDLDKFVVKNADLVHDYFNTPYRDAKDKDFLEIYLFYTMFTSIPIKGKPFICESLLNSFFSYNDYWCYRWATNMEIDRNFYYILPTPPRDFSRQVAKKLASVAPLDKIVLFAPDAVTAIELPVEFWNVIAEHVHAQGYTVLVNSQKYRLAHGISAFDLDLSLEDVVALGLACDSVFSLRSGLCDVLAGAGKRLYAVYPSMLRREMGSLNTPFAIPTGVHEILLHNWQLNGKIVWKDTDLTPALQKLLIAWRANYLKEKRKAFFSFTRSRKDGHLFWQNIFNHIAGYSKWFPDNNRKCPQSKNKKVAFGPFTLYERSYFPDRVRTSVLGGLFRKVRQRDRSCRLYLFGLCVYSRRFTLFKTTRLLGVTIQKKPWRDRLLKAFTRQLDPERHTVYILPYHIGETWAFLAHAEHWLKGDPGDIQVAVWQKNQLPLYRMFLPDDIPLVCVSLECGQRRALFGSEPVTAGAFTIFSADAHIARTLLAGLRVSGSGNFYAHIKGVLQAGDSAPRTPRISRTTKSMVDDLLDGLDMKQRFVVLLPEASTSMPLDEVFWQQLAHALQRKGYALVVNGGPAPDGAISCKLPIDAFYELASRSAGVIALASGMAVLLSAARVKMDVLYTAFKNHDGYTSSVALACYSLRHIEGVSMDTVREWDTDAFSLDSIRENILARY